MPVSFTIFEERGFFLSTWSGAITDSVLLSSYKQLFEDEKYKPGFHEIADLRKARFDNLTSEGFRNLSKMVDSYLAGKCESFKTAMIVSHDFPYGMSRMYEVFSSNTPETVQVFRDPNKAIEWIGVGNFSLD